MTHTPPEHTDLPSPLAPLPDYLNWLTERIQGLIRPAACLRPDRDRPAHPGSTRAWGPPDVPADADWTQNSSYWDGSPYDGESFVFQLDMAEIPAVLRKAEWPIQGIVWVFLDFSDERKGWRAISRFDPRARKDIPWSPRAADAEPRAASWEVRPSLADGTEQTMPAIWSTWQDEEGGLVGAYSQWAQEHYGIPAGRDFQVGGWTWPCQGDFDERNQDFVCVLIRQAWGDNGEVSLHYDPKNGFYARVDTH